MKYLLITISLFALACSKPKMYECQETTYLQSGTVYNSYQMEFDSEDDMHNWVIRANADKPNTTTTCRQL